MCDQHTCITLIYVSVISIHVLIIINGSFARCPKRRKPPNLISNVFKPSYMHSLFVFSSLAAEHVSHLHLFTSSALQCCRWYGHSMPSEVGNMDVPLGHIQQYRQSKHKTKGKSDHETGRYPSICCDHLSYAEQWQFTYIIGSSCIAKSTHSRKKTEFIFDMVPIVPVLVAIAIQSRFI